MSLFTIRLAWPIITLFVGAQAMTGCTNDAGQDPASGTQVEEETVSNIQLGPGVTHREQIEEIGAVVSLMQEHLGDGYEIRGGETEEWDVDHYTEHRHPRPGCGGPEEFYNDAYFDYQELSSADAFRGAQVIAENLGFEPNESVIDDGASGSRMYFAAFGEDGRRLIVRDQSEDPEIVEVRYSAPCSDHQSLREATDRAMDSHFGEDD